jgi:hypothetical protein
LQAGREPVGSINDFWEFHFGRFYWGDMFPSKQRRMSRQHWDIFSRALPAFSNSGSGGEGLASLPLHEVNARGDSRGGVASIQKQKPKETSILLSD